MKELDIFKYPKFMDHYGPLSEFKTWAYCLIDTGIKDPRYISTLCFYITDEEYTWFVLRWS